MHLQVVDICSHRSMQASRRGEQLPVAGLVKHCISEIGNLLYSKVCGCMSCRQECVPQIVQLPLLFFQTAAILEVGLR